MKRKLNWRYALGAAALAAALAVILLSFWRMSRPVLREQYLSDSPDARNGWRYELFEDGQVRSWELAFEDDSPSPALPEGIDAVRIARDLTEEIPNAEMEWHSYFDGVEVFLDGELLHSDFREGAERGADGFLRLTDEDWEQLHSAQGDVWRRVRMSLPADYLGKELSLITYFPEGWGTPAPEYPYLGNDESYIASFIAYSVRDDVALTVFALLALLIAAMYLLDVSNADADAKVLLLSLYFLLLFLYRSITSYAGYYGGLGAHVDVNLLSELYVAPLYLYLALRLKRRWRVLLGGAIAAWTLYEIVHWYLWPERGQIGIAGRAGPWGLAVFLAVAAATCADEIARARRARWSGKRAAFYPLCIAAIAFGYLFNKVHAWGGARAYLVEGIWGALRVGSFEPALSLVTDIVSVMVLIAVVSGFVRRTLRGRQEMSVLQDRARQTMESYERLLTVQDATNVLRHEMRHHMIALSGMLRAGEAERARRYVDAVAGDMDRLPTGRYSPNMLVDAIAGSFLDRAWSRGIRVEHRLNVPPEMNIADEDLSVFLSNMLQNALEACERMDEGAERYIRVDMRLSGNFLFIRCVNSAAKGPPQPVRSGRGYGLAAMRKVAEKYNSALLIERAPGEFSVMSDLCLGQR